MFSKPGDVKLERIPRRPMVQVDKVECRVADEKEFHEPFPAALLNENAHLWDNSQLSPEHWHFELAKGGN